MEPGSELKKLANILGSSLVLSEDGQTRVWLNSKELPVISGFIESILKLPLFNPSQQKLLLSMLESLLKNKKTTFNDRQSLCSLSSLVLQLLRILDLALTSSEEDFSNYWNCLVKEEYKNLWLPVKSDCVGSVSTLSNGVFFKTIQNSWFLTNVINPPRRSLQKTSWLFYKSLLADGMESEATVLRTRKIKLLLTSLQKAQLEDWRNDARYCYNKAVWLSEESTIPLSKLDLRNLITPEETCTRTEWLLRTPKAVRESAVFEAAKNKQACFTNLANGNIKHFKQRFLSKKKESWTISGFDKVKREDDYSLSLYPTYGVGHFKCKEVLPEIDKTCSIHFDGLNYFVCIPVEVSVKNIAGRDPIVSADPGVRTFHTFYDAFNRSVYKVGDGAATEMYTLLYRMDKLISQKTRATKTKQKLLTKQISKIRLELKNMQKELHWKVANWLCSSYSTVVIPKFGSKEMSSKATRNIGSKTVRNMMVLGHCNFLERLKTKAQEFGTRIVVVDEVNTTKTCGNCMHLQNHIRGKSSWNCESCDWQHDRDGNASRNILFKHYKV